MLLPSSHSHDKLCVDVLGARIVLLPMDRPCRRHVLAEAAVDASVGVRLGRVLGVVGDVGRRLALVGHSPCLQGGARLATMRRRLREREQNEYKSGRIGLLNRYLNSRTHACAYPARLRLP